MSSSQGTLPAAPLRRRTPWHHLGGERLRRNGLLRRIIKVGRHASRPSRRHAPNAHFNRRRCGSVRMGRISAFAYYVSTVGGQGSRPVVFMNGDQLEEINTRTWQWLVPPKDHVPGPEKMDVDTE